MVICSSRSQPDMGENLTDKISDFSELPDLPLLKIFEYLEVREKLTCSQVCKRWNRLVFTPSPWRTVYVTTMEGKWGRCELNFYDSPNCHDLYEEKKWLLLDGFYLKIVDSSLSLLDIVFEEVRRGMPMLERVITEYRLLIGYLENVLPKVGPNVKNIFLNANSGVSDYMLNLYLILCPNVEKLDVRFTALSSKAFLGLSQYGCIRKLQGLNLMGCKRVDDTTLWNLAECWNAMTRESTEGCNDKSIDVPNFTVCVRDVCSEYITADDDVLDSCDFYTLKRNVKTFFCPPNNFSNSASTGLKFLSLAGCSKITDVGLEYLAKCKYVYSLELLDVSGCAGLTSRGLNNLAAKCPQLKPQNLYYCDMIADGPFSEEANGCQTEGGECCLN